MAKEIKRVFRDRDGVVWVRDGATSQPARLGGVADAVELANAALVEALREPGEDELSPRAADEVREYLAGLEAARGAVRAAGEEEGEEEGREAEHEDDQRDHGREDLPADPAGETLDGVVVEPDGLH